MLVAALVITFGAASIIERRAVGPVNTEQFSIIEAARQPPLKAVPSKERAPAQSRERSVHATSTQVGL